MSDLAFIVGAIVAAIFSLAALSGVIVVVIVRPLMTGSPPKDILQQRYARGDLTREQYEQMRADLGLVSTVPESSSPLPLGELKVFRWTGWFGIAGVVLLAIELVLRTLPAAPPQISDAGAYAAFLAHNRINALTWVLLDMGMYACLMVFFAGFRHLIVRTRADYEWAGTLTLVAGGIWWAVSLVADGLHGAAVLDASGGTRDPTIVRALTEATLLIYNGAIAFAVTGLFMAVAGYAILATRALPRWTGWFAVGSAVLCGASLPAMYATVVDPRGFYNAAGWGPIIVANVPPLIWFVIVSVLMVRMRRDPTRPGLQR